MLSLVGKDLRAGALYLAVKAPVLGLFLLESLLIGKRFVIVASVEAAILAVVASALDWSVGAEPFVHSLPVSRRDVVKARYATFLLLSGVWLAVAAITALIVASIVLARGGIWPAWVALEAVLRAVIYVGVFIAIFPACVFRFGMGRGGVVATLVLAVLAPLGISLVRPADVEWLLGAIGIVPACAGVTVAVGLVIWMSMRISMRCYERREF
jgi:hypothetical protein